jgi:hypothetical protein
MCRIIFGCLNTDGEILSGSNGDDPAVDFSVEKIGDELEVHYQTSFTGKPSVTVTPNYGPLPVGDFGHRFRNVVLTSNEPNRFRLRLSPESNARMPVDLSFISIK